ncbi:MAG: CBS domain-containing protein [Bacteriovoracaceae bacterium]|jgi:CBS domain-containing protein|nr:hypothetical protein [Halobacteriovoraceae bacterium]MDP7321001.1 CBS domain-containing protein [Bacteriovoracaceae bacterium]
MSFFILVQNGVHEHEFTYLSGHDKKLDDTLVTPANKKKVHRFNKEQYGGMVFAKDIMTSKVVTFNLNHSVKEALEYMHRNRIHHLPIIDESQLVGLVTINDLKKFQSHLQMGDNELKSIMTKTILCVSEMTPLKDILKVFIHESIHSLPVVNNELFLAGILTQNDIFKWMLSHKKYLK